MEFRQNAYTIQIQSLYSFLSINRKFSAIILYVTSIPEYTQMFVTDFGY